MESAYYIKSDGHYNTSKQPVHLTVVNDRHWQVPRQIQTEEAYRKYRPKRGEISRRFRTRGVIQCLLGSLLGIIGAIGIYYGAPDVPYVIPIHIITGFVLIAVGMCSFQGGKRIEDENTVTQKTKCLMIAVFSLNIVGITFSFLTAAINGGMGVGFCLGTEFSRTTINGRVFQTENDQCTENKDVNIAISATYIVIGVLAGIHCILGLPFFCIYGPVFGIYNNKKTCM